MNRNQKVINEFGDEWKEFNFSDIEKNELIKASINILKFFLGINYLKILQDLIWGVALDAGLNL